MLEIELRAMNCQYRSGSFIFAITQSSQEEQLLGFETIPISQLSFRVPLDVTLFKCVEAPGSFV